VTSSQVTATGTDEWRELDEPKHKHWFHALWATPGPYGDQSVHYHPCSGDAEIIDTALDNGTDRTLELEPCDWALFGVGRNCGGKKSRHWRQSLHNRVVAHIDRERAGV
jgi:hypothetical protein